MNRSLAHGKTLRGAGFTMVEVMVALVVLAVGLLGMAGMTAVMMRGSRGASDLANATNICQQKIEGLKDVPWADLGSRTSSNTAQEQLDNGLVLAGMIQETDLNSQGLTWVQLCNQQRSISGSACDGQTIATCGTLQATNCSGVTSTGCTCQSFVNQAGPYKYTRTFSICKGEDYTTGVITPGSGPTAFASTYSAEPNCKANPASFRPATVACEINDILTPGTGSPEKMIKVLCTWVTKEGRCSYVNFEALRMSGL